MDPATDNAPRPLTSDDFNDFATAQLERANVMLAGKPDSLMPQLIVRALGVDGNSSLIVCALATNFNIPDEKHEALATVGRMMYEKEVIPMAVALISEAWMAKAKSPHAAPSDCPDKREVVIVVATTIDRRHCTMTAIPIKRDDENRMEIDGEVDLSVNSGNGKPHFPLIDHFFRGFFEKIQAKMKTWEQDSTAE